MDINFSKSQGSDSSLRDGSWAAFQELAAKTPHQLLSCPKMVHSQAKHLQVWVKKNHGRKKTIPNSLMKGFSEWIFVAK